MIVTPLPRLRNNCFARQWKRIVRAEAFDAAIVPLTVRTSSQPPLSSLTTKSRNRIREAAGAKPERTLILKHSGAVADGWSFELQHGIVLVAG